MLCVVIIAMVDYENGNQVKLLEIFKIILFFSYFIKLFISKFEFFKIIQGIEMEVYLFYFGILNVVFCVSLFSIVRINNLLFNLDNLSVKIEGFV